MLRKLLKFAFITLILLPYTSSSSISSEPQHLVEFYENKEFEKSCFIAAFNITAENIGECLDHCLNNCSCQSFQICHMKECQLCSRNKMEDSSLLRDKDGCIYYMYKNMLEYSPGILKKIPLESSILEYPMRYNCCSQQTGLCPKNKICKLINLPEQPWKRFTCECPNDYYGENCDKKVQPHTRGSHGDNYKLSCHAYSKGSRATGMYKIQGSDGIYDVYCYFDSYGAWTLVQSYSFANTIDKPLDQDYPNSSSYPTSSPAWSGYRLSNARMKSIVKYSTLLRFTCEFEKKQNVEESDYFQLSLKDLSGDVLSLRGGLLIKKPSAKIRESSISDGCVIRLRQTSKTNLFVRLFLDLSDNSTCGLSLSPSRSPCSRVNYFGNLKRRVCWRLDGVTHCSCHDTKHRCSINNDSTTQLWLGHE